MSAEQIAAEERVDGEALLNALKAQAAIVAKGDIDKMPRGKALIARMFDDVRESIVAEQAKKHRGVGAALRGWLRELDASVGAVVALRIVMGMVVQSYGNGEPVPATFQRLTTGIGRAWALEIKVAAAARINPVYYDGAVQRLKDTNTTSKKHVQMAMSRVVANSLDGVYDEDLTPTEYMHLGKVGLQACMDAGLVEVSRTTNRKGHNVEYVLTEPVAAFLLDEKVPNWAIVTDDLTMLAPPLPWTHVVGGGFHTEKRQLRYPLVRTSRRVRHKHVREYRNRMTAEGMPGVFNPINYLQSIPYRVDEECFKVAHNVWINGGGVLQIPSRAEAPKPEFPHGEEWVRADATPEELVAFNRWKRATFAWHNTERILKSLRWSMAHFTRTCLNYVEKPLWFAMFMDTRGRLYYRNTVSPQGTDPIKGALKFHRKKPLGKRGVYWLKVHIANCFGVDDVRFKERAAWTDVNWEYLLQGAEDPANSDLYRGNKDAPFMAVAAVRDLAAAYASGNPETYESGTIVHMDATCSGLQHLSALLRDPVGGRYVNLVDLGEAKKADIYARVALLAKMQVERDAEGGMECAKLWLPLLKDPKACRKLAKSPVMTYVYGATMRSVAEGVGAFLDDEGYDYKVSGVSDAKMSMYLTKLLFRAIEDTVPAAAALMRWLKQVVRLHPRTEPVVFPTPHGLLVHHDYPDEEQTRVRVRSCGLEYVVMHNQLETSKTTRMQNAISPNFVHSLDATHLCFTARRMEALGLDMAVIHDSFGTHACDVDAMHQAIREAFVELYGDTNLCAVFAEATGTTLDIPAQGTLDIRLVLNSEFFFC